MELAQYLDKAEEPELKGAVRSREYSGTSNLHTIDFDQLFPSMPLRGLVRSKEGGRTFLVGPLGSHNPSCCFSSRSRIVLTCSSDSSEGCDWIWIQELYPDQFWSDRIGKINREVKLHEDRVLRVLCVYKKSA